MAYRREGERRRPSARSYRAEPSRAERSPSLAESSRDEHLPPPPPRARGASPPPSPAPRCWPGPPTMPHVPPALATPQPSSALSARSCCAVAPGMQVSEGPPTPPAQGARPSPSRLRAFSLRPSPRGRSPGLQPPASKRSFPAVLSVPPRLLAPSALLAQRPRSLKLPPSCLWLRLFASSSFGFPACSRRFLPRSPFADLLVLVPPTPLSCRFPAQYLVRVPVGGVGSGQR